MKTPIQNSLRFASVGLCLISSLLAQNAMGFAGDTWDPQGTATGKPTSGTWESVSWSTLTSEAAMAPVNWVEGGAALFAFGATGGTNTLLTITMNSNHTVAGIFNGPLAPASCFLTITGPGIMTMPGTAAQGFDTGGTILGSTTVKTVIAGTAILEPEGSGSLYLFATNTYSGGTLLGGGGGVNFNNNASFGTGTITWGTASTVLATPAVDGMGNTGATGPITIANKVVTISGSQVFVGIPAAPVTFSGTMSIPTGTVTLDVRPAGYTETISGVISGAANFTKIGPAILALNGANTYGGSTTITNGSIQLGNSAGIGKSFLTNTAPGSIDLHGFSPTVNGLSGNGVVDNLAAGASVITIGVSNGTSSFAGAIKNTSGTVGLTKSGTGTFTLSSTNSYAGPTTINAGTFTLGGDNEIPAGSAVSVIAGATLAMANHNDTVASLSGGGRITNNNTLSVTGTNAVLGAATGQYSCFFGPIDTGTLIKDGNHTMALRSTNLYNINFLFNNGALSVGATSNCLPTSTAMFVPPGGLFQLDANNQTLASLSGQGNVNLGGGTLTVNVTDGNAYDFSGVIQNSDLPGSSTALGQGLRGYYYSNIDFSGLAAVRDDSTVNFTNLTLASSLPTPPFPKTNQISIRWLGQVLTESSGTYSFITTSDDGARLWVNGTNLVDSWVSQGGVSKTNTITLAGNTRYDIVMEYMNISGGASAKLSWIAPGDIASSIIPAANLFLPSAGNLIYKGSGAGSSLVLQASNTYSGGTTILSSILEGQFDGALGQGNVYISNNATLLLDGGATSSYISSNADLVMSGANSKVNLAFSGVNTIHALSMDGGVTYLATGTYGSASSGAAHTSSQFLGTGLLNVTAAPSTTTLASSGSPTVYGNTVTLTATVTGAAGTPTGSVTFFDGASAIGVGTLNGSGQAVLNISTLLVPTSPHSITAVYGGNVAYAQSSSLAISQTVTPLSVTAGTFVVANKVYDTTTSATFVSGTAAGVLAADTNSVHITGTATFVTKTAGTNKAVSITNLLLTGSQAGNYTLTSSNASATANITPVGLLAFGFSIANQPYTGTTNVLSLDSSSAQVSGVLSGDVVALNGASAVANFTNATVGVNKTAFISGLILGGPDGGNYIVSPQATAFGTITQASTTNILVSSANPSAPGAAVSFTATPTGIAPGGGVATGSIVFQTNGVTFSTVTLAAGSATSASLTNLTGTTTITANYAGDVNFTGSTGTLQQVVQLVVPTSITVSYNGAATVLNWTGSHTLQSAVAVNNVNSGFTNVPGPILTGPYTNTATNKALFFRLSN